MNERERFEEWAWTWYLKTAKKHDFERIEKKELFCYEGNRYYREDTNNHWITWQARDEIAKQDEKELIEVLRDMVAYHVGLNEHPSCNFLDTAKRVLEKHTGKTWEESNAE